MNARHHRSEHTPPNPADNGLGVHPDILKPGLASLLTDLSSEMVLRFSASDKDPNPD